MWRQIRFTPISSYSRDASASARCTVAAFPPGLRHTVTSGSAWTGRACAVIVRNIKIQKEFRKIHMRGTSLLIRAENDGESGHRHAKLRGRGFLALTGGYSEVTGLLRSWGAGDESALHRLTDLLLPELRRIAHRYLRDEHAVDSLQTTALVNEVYLRLVEIRGIDWQHRAQFFALIAQLVRRILVDAARKRSAQKRGGAATLVGLEETEIAAPRADSLLLALDEALLEFARIAPRQAKVVELRYFGGLSEEETAQVMDSSPRTVRRDWQFAKVWLSRELGSLS
ncbi:MAG: ECF-type sigma factor [Paludibaculum sp.]